MSILLFFVIFFIFATSIATLAALFGMLFIIPLEHYITKEIRDEEED